MHAACDLCGHQRFRRTISGPDYRAGVPGSFEAYACLTCGLVSVLPPPAPDVLQAHYPDSLWEAELTTPGPLKQRLALAADLLLRLHPTPGRLLDVGCATGDFVSTMVGLRWQACGVEAGERQAALARGRGLDVVHHGDFPRYEAAPFDAITFNHVLEHVPSPRAYLTRARQLLRAAGVLLVSVPNYASLSRRVFGRYWAHLDLPRHLYHFTPATLTRLVEDTGFSEVQVHPGSREDDAAGVQSSLRRWLQYRLVGRRTGSQEADPGVCRGPARGRSAARTPVRAVGWLYAVATERTGLADTFVLTARPTPPH